MPRGNNPTTRREILLLLSKEGGTCGFTTLWKRISHSKSTLARHLAELEQSHLVEKVKLEGLAKEKYHLTPAGEAQVKNEVVARISEKERNLGGNKPSGTIQLQMLVNFYKRIMVDEGFIWRIALLYSRLGEKIATLVTLGENDELYWALFYIFTNLAENANTLAMNLREFCEQYGLKQLSLEYYLDKILSLDVGVHRVKQGLVDCFFHDADELGTNLRRLVDDQLDQFLLRSRWAQEMRATPSEKGKGEEKLAVHEMTRQVLDTLLAKNLLTERWRDPFMEEVRRHIVKRALERGLPPDLLPLKAKPEVETSLPYLAHVEDMQGFCANCGVWILRGVRECPRCQAPITEEASLVADFRQARELTRKYKEKQALESNNCPQCGSRLPPGEIQEICPSCGASLVSFSEEKEE